MVEMLNRNNQPEMGGWKNGISWRRRKEQEGEKRVREREERKVEGRGPSFSRLDLLPPLIDPKTAEVLSGDQKIRVADLPRKAQGRVCHLVRHPQDDDIEVAAGQAQPCGLRAEEHCA